MKELINAAQSMVNLSDHLQEHWPEVWKELVQIPSVRHNYGELIAAIAVAQFELATTLPKRTNAEDQDE